MSATVATKTSMERHREHCPNGCGYCTEISPITAKQVAQAAGIAPRTKQFTFYDEFGFAYEGPRAAHVLVAIGKADNIDRSVNIAALAVHKCLTTARMNVLLARHLREDLTPYQLCGVVAKVVNEYGAYKLHTGGVGEVADFWLNAHADLF